jgi:uncharacterized phage protein gp47/JayE
MYHQLQGDLVFLADQLFPDTATGEFLRLHWSDRVPPLYAVAARGVLAVSGFPGAAVPAGLVYASPAGKRYYTGAAYRIGGEGAVTVQVTAEEPGADSNLGAGVDLSLVTAIPPGLDSTAATTGEGISGGADAETDEAYLVRVLQYLRNTARYGKPGDFAAWAVDSSPEVSAAWEFPHFGVFGALLIQVTGGNQIDGVTPVGNLALVRDYLSTVAPPVIFTVRTPDLLPLAPAVALDPAEDTAPVRETVVSRLKMYLQATALPGITYTAGKLRDAVVDGVLISAATVKLGGSPTGVISSTILQLPVLGEVTWE